MASNAVSSARPAASPAPRLPDDQCGPRESGSFRTHHSTQPGSQNVDSHSPKPRLSRLSTSYRFLNQPLLSRNGLCLDLAIHPFNNSTRTHAFHPCYPATFSIFPASLKKIKTPLQIIENRLKKIETTVREAKVSFGATDLWRAGAANSQSIEKAPAYFQPLAQKKIEKTIREAKISFGTPDLWRAGAAKTIFSAGRPVHAISQPANLPTWNLHTLFRPQPVYISPEKSGKISPEPHALSHFSRFLFFLFKLETASGKPSGPLQITQFTQFGLGNQPFTAKLQLEVMMKSFCLGISLLVVVLAGSGCSSTQSAKARPLKPVYGQGVDLSRFEVATVQPFQPSGRDAADAEAGRTFANAIARRLEYDFGNLFQEVRVGEPLGQPNEVVVTGRITEYQPGSRWARLMGPGIGKAELEGELVLKEATSDQPILIAPIDKLWAWGHSVGAAKGIEDMMEESAAAAANMIARAKGWEPPAQASVHR